MSADLYGFLPRLKESTSSASHESSNEIAASLERYKQLKSEHESLAQETNDLHLQVSRLEASVSTAVQQNERYRSQVANLSSEAEQYRARATRVLQEKEKLIASLQASKQIEGQSHIDPMLDQELEQMRCVYSFFYCDCFCYELNETFEMPVK